MKIVGICGSSGSGKSTVSYYLKELGLEILDCDKIYHLLVDHPSACLKEIGECFGFDLIADGKLDRKKLGSIVFSDREKLLKLNEISHRHVIDYVENSIQALAKDGVLACGIDAPMLFESGLDRRCDYVIAVIADQDAQIKRICERDGIDREAVLKRLANQISADELSKRADFVIKNNGTVEDLKMQCKKIYNMILIDGGK